jgi:hypothetical protein
METGKWSQAADCYGKLKEVDQNNATVHKLLAQALSKVGKWNEAII